MNLSSNRIARALILLLLLSPGFAVAAGLFGGKDVIWRDSANEYVKYAEQDTSRAGKNEHPVDLNADEITTVLKSLRLEGDDAPVFTDRQAALLGQHLTEGLKRAGRDQDVVFALKKTVSRALGLKPDEFFVAGRSFFSGNKLNVIVGDYDRRRDFAYEAAVDPTHQGIVNYNFDHGRRATSSRAFTKVLKEANGVARQARRPDWLLIDVGMASDSVDRMRVAREKQERARKREEIKALLADDDAEQPSVPAQRPMATAQERPSRAVQERPSVATRTIEERLTVLKRLKSKDLITDEEYAQKRKQILDEL